MTTLNTIIEEEKKEARRLFDLTLDCKLVPKDIEDAIATAKQRAYEAGEKKGREEERERIIKITTTNQDAFMMPATEQRWLKAIHPELDQDKTQTP